MQNVFSRRKRNSGRILTAAGILMLFCAGCGTTYTLEDQQKLAGDYYSGNLAKAAERAEKISREEEQYSSREALMWHLEAGNVCLAADRTAEALEALNRAEKLLYEFDSEGHADLHCPGKLTYTGYRSDRLLLHLLKGFVYLSRGEMEDFLVELRRMRVSQFHYLLQDSDPELRDYEKKNRKSGVMPFYLARNVRNNLKSQAFQKSGMNGPYLEYSQRRRPELSILFHPVGFYLSAVGYYFDNDWDEALIDLKYLASIDPGNQLFQRDHATLCRMLGEAHPNRSRQWDHALGDQVVYVIYAQGHPLDWKTNRKVFRLPGMITSHWNFSYPDYTSFQGGSVEVTSGGEKTSTVFLADLGDILREEFWQLNFSAMMDEMVRTTQATTAKNTAAKAALAAAIASPNDETKSLRIALATAAVRASENAYINQTEWRRWSTVPRNFSILHLPLGKPEERTIRLQIRDRSGKVLETRSFVPDEDVNRVVIYIRELDYSRYIKYWTSRE